MHKCLVGLRGGVSGFPQKDGVKRGKEEQLNTKSVLLYIALLYNLNAYKVPVTKI